MDQIQERLLSIIRAQVEAYTARPDIAVRFREPLCAFADAQASGMRALPGLIPGHILPTDALPGATAVFCYFLPFAPEIEASNREGRLAAAHWARCYEETNALFPLVNEKIIAQVRLWGFDAAVPQEATAFDREKLVSRWSQRHVAYQSGLGTFGLHNLLITASGCTGRLSSVVTTLPRACISLGAPSAFERCAYKRDGSCGACVGRCPSGALSDSGYDRHKCFALCLENAALYNDFGNSYADTAGEAAVSSGSEVCGKCCVGVPCAFKG